NRRLQPPAPSPAAVHTHLLELELLDRRSLPHVSVEGYGTPRHLHSFPTRRSSDLAADAALSCAVATPSRLALSTTSIARAISPRSEEHTSELQSLTNLVCRLLLPKKQRVDRLRVTQTGLRGGHGHSQADGTPRRPD